MDDVMYMKEALLEAAKALERSEIPIGAIIVKDGEIIGRGHNRRLADASPFGHAEMNAMKEAAAKLDSWRFDDCTVYVTLEPCVMCAGALTQCRVSRIVYGAKDPKAGGAGSLYDIPNDPRMYHRCAVTAGVLKYECAEMLHRFFRNKRRRG